MSYIGNEPVVSATRTITEITATAGQTVFVANGGYTVGFIDVFVNGAQLQTSDFTATNGSTVTLASAASVGDDVRLVAWGIFSTGAITPAALSTPNAVYWDGSGNVGVGTTTPTTRLNVYKLSNGNIAQFSNGADADLYVNLTSGVSRISPSTGTLALGTLDTERMRIDSSGNVGVGTTSPTNFGSNFRLMEVKGTDYGVVQATSTSGSTTIEMMGGVGVGFLSTRTNHPLVFRTNDTERMRIDTSGRVTKPNQPAFSINGLSTTIFNANTGASGYLNGGSANTNVGNCYDSTTGRFTAPVAGRYLITAAVLVNSGSGRLEGNVFVNGNSTNFSFNGTGSTYDGACVTCILTLNANDYVTICRNSGVAYSNHGNNYFNGYLLG